MIKKWIILVCFFLALSGRAETLLVLAAASTTDAMTEIGQLFTEKSGHAVRFSFASSGALARQIQSGAPADLFLSANEKWMDALDSGGLIDSASRVDLLKNRLVLIVPIGGRVALDAAFSGRLAVGNMQSVPAGMYARQALEKLGLLPALRPRLISGDSVRNVLFFVERGEVDAGIVYATDARISKRVTVESVFPEDSHDPICYPVAVCAASAHRAAAGDLCRFLQSGEAQAVFTAHGFERGAK